MSTKGSKPNASSPRKPATLNQKLGRCQIKSLFIAQSQLKTIRICLAVAEIGTQTRSEITEETGVEHLKDYRITCRGRIIMPLRSKPAFGRRAGPLVGEGQGVWLGQRGQWASRPLWKLRLSGFSPDCRFHAE